MKATPTRTGMRRWATRNGPRPSRTVTRRRLIKSGVAAGAGLSLTRGRLIESAMAASRDQGSLSEIEHVVLLMQENRSFDQYYGTMPGVRGFGDTTSYSSYAGGPRTSPATVFSQSMVGASLGGTTVSYALADGETTLEPFELLSHPPTVAGQTTNDITHDWGPQHGSWNNGAMDRFAVEHLAEDPTAAYQISDTDGVPLPGKSSYPIGVLTMGYYRQRDCLAFHRALADAFTICDKYFCSVLGPTDPNRLVWLSGSLGAHTGDVGGPVLETYVGNREQMIGTLDWPTMPELLTDNGVSWKVYQDPTSNFLFDVLGYFKHFADPSTPTQVANAEKAFAPVYPAEFVADVVSGTLPQVSYLIPPAPCCEHPATPPEYGEYLISQILQTLLLNPEVWERTVFIVIYDENGGWFDHVSPPTPGPLATVANGLAKAGSYYDGEYVTSTDPSDAAGGPPSDWDKVLGPVGLGFRVPGLIISPFSAGGWVCPDTFDFVSTLKFIEKLFLKPGTLMGSDGLHISPWRYNEVGDLTSALPNLSTPITTVPPLPPTSLLYPETAQQALLNSLAGTEDYAQAYPPPPSNGGIPRPDADSLATRRTTPT